MLPIRVSGSITGPGTRSPLAATATPASEPSAIGLRIGVSSRRHSGPFPPPPDKSRIVTATGVTSTSWNSSTGATSEASPSTYTAIGMPRLPAFT